ncbi:MAG TPA: hypothetical protein VM818_14390 [Vicinamibacterales bacterium]|nr:hypothetical protein [Vicinamibacterales bacterium]
MLRPNNRQWWLLVGVVLFIVCAWPSTGDRSLLCKLVNWSVDPWNELPVLPEQLPLGLGDDPDAVAARDTIVQQYDALYLKGGWTRTRLELKVARDPFNPSTERQLLTALGGLTVLVAWKLGGEASNPRS